MSIYLSMCAWNLPAALSVSKRVLRAQNPP